MSRWTSVVLASVIAGCAACTGARPAATPEATASPAREERPVADETRCLASTARQPPRGWTETGKLVVQMQDGQPTAMEARTLEGRIVESRAAPKSAREARTVLAELTCRVGGVVAALEGAEPPREGASTTTLVAFRPGVPDEKADLATLCREPDGLPANADERQRLRLSVDRYEEVLTTRRWRGWLRDLVEEDALKEGAERILLWTARADELQLAAKKAGVAGGCWLEAGLRRAAR